MQKAKASQFTTAIAVYKPTEPDQISLEEGDFVEILNKSDDQEWWYGQKVRGKKTGWFPSTYVKPIGGKVGGAVAGFLGALSERQQKDASRQSAPQKAANKLNGCKLFFQRINLFHAWTHFLQLHFWQLKTKSSALN